MEPTNKKIKLANGNAKQVSQASNSSPKQPAKKAMIQTSIFAFAKKVTAAQSPDNEIQNNSIAQKSNDRFESSQNSNTSDHHSIFESQDRKKLIEQSMEGLESAELFSFDFAAKNNVSGLQEPSIQHDSTSLTKNNLQKSDQSRLNPNTSKTVEAAGTISNRAGTASLRNSSTSRLDGIDESLIKHVKESKLSSMDADEQREYDRKEKNRVKNRDKYSFLDDPMDAQQRKRGDPDYDERTLFIPFSIYCHMSDFEKQYWDIKCQYFNSIVFFQKGIFYELMENDAEIAQKELGLVLTNRAGMKMTGFGIKEAETQKSKLVSKGYSVVIVKQVETPVDRRLSTNQAQTTQQSSKSTNIDSPSKNSNPKKRKADLITDSDNNNNEVMLKRIVDRVITPGTATDEIFFANLENSNNFQLSIYLLSITMNIKVDEHGKKFKSFGICLLDASRSIWTIGEIDENSLDAYENLKTFLFRTRPKEVIFEKESLDKHVLKLIKLNLSESSIMTARFAKDCVSFEESTKMLCSLPSFKTSSFQSNYTEENIISFIWPNALKKYRNEEKVIKAVGNVLQYLKALNRNDLLSNPSQWTTLDLYNSSTNISSLILDSKALKNLHILENDEGNIKNSVFGLFTTQTPMGRRLLLKWICHPLKNAYHVERRISIIDYMISNPEFTQSLQEGLETVKKCDFDRLLSKCSSKTLLLKEFLILIESLQSISILFVSQWIKFMRSAKESQMPVDLFLLLSRFFGFLPPSFSKHFNQNNSSMDIDGSESMETSINDANFSASLKPFDERTEGLVDEYEYRKTFFGSIDISRTAHEEISSIFGFFDFEEAKNNEILIPSAGFDAEYDKAQENYAKVNEEMKIELEEIREWYQNRGAGKQAASICIVDVGNVNRLIEVPSSIITDYGVHESLQEHSKKSTAKLKRFYTSKIENLLSKWEETKLFAERASIGSLLLLQNRVASSSHIWWNNWSDALAQLDCLLAICKTSQNFAEIQSRPVIYAQDGEIDDQKFDHLPEYVTFEGTRIEIPNKNKKIQLKSSKTSFLHFEQLYHPLLNSGVKKLFGDDSMNMEGRFDANRGYLSDYIPNDVKIGKCEFLDLSGTETQNKNDGYSTILLTGPNMGGKSTLLRSVCVNVVLIQLGCFAFSRSCHLTTADRIFTRIGASDQIFEGRSTFMVELEEAAEILRFGTKKSICILDELGRGTSTYDGYSIAYATLYHIVTQIECPTLFSTHYHLLTDDVKSDPILSSRVGLYHMDASLYDENGNLIDNKSQIEKRSMSTIVSKTSAFASKSGSSVVFLYKMVPGVCPASYGMMVASMAKIPREVVQAAKNRSIAFQIQQQANHFHKEEAKQKYLELATLYMKMQENAIKMRAN